ncbi:hypothetical protein K438DRAFT_1966916 [Mycena galopus ATCC 62051]|nr:hypothetical protein K438DRAFT_1966916 [Mycena galopus ATCC 62051]
MTVPLDFDATEIIEIEDSDSEVLVISPGQLERNPMDIARDFEATVKAGFTFDGNFAFSTRYSTRDAPNPCLKIDGIGTVGIPLSERDALAIISAAVPVCAAHDSTPSIWEVPADKIHFDDPAWESWIRKTVFAATYTSLELNPTPGKTSPTCTLRKLVIHEPGSPQTNFQNECGLSEGHIADLDVVLPSSFTGGQLQLRHGLETKYLDLSHDSGILTSAVAAYVGVRHTSFPVTSGYRLSLLYDINQPTQVHRGLAESQGAAQKLGHILQRWNDAADPEFLACLLRHTYTVEDNKNFDIEMLRGVDGQLISQLIPLVRELGFRLCFAHVSLTVTASASAENFAQNRRSGYIRCDDSESDDSIDEENFQIREDDQEDDFQVLKVLDLSGMPIEVNTGLETMDLLNGSMTDGSPDDEDFEKYDRTSGRKTETWNRTVLLLWPIGGSMESKVKIGNICDYVSNTLRDSKSAAPTAREKELIEMLAKCCTIPRDEKKLQRVVRALRKSSDRWNDAEQYIRGLLACGVDRRTDLLGVEGFISAYRAFGWDALKELQAMENDQSNARRQVLLLRLSKIAAEENNSEIASWCKTQDENVLRCLSKLDAQQLPWLMELSRSRGVEFLRDVYALPSATTLSVYICFSVFPQLRNQNLDKLFWIPFLRALQENRPPIPNFSPAIMEGLIIQCFSETARTLPPFPTKILKPNYPGQPVHEEADCEPILDVINLLVENGHAELCSQIFTAMRDAKHHVAYSDLCPPPQYYVQLSSPLIRLISSAPAPATAIFQPFFADVLESMISAPPPGPRILSWEKPTGLLQQNLSIFRAAARMAGGLSAVKSSLISANLHAHSSSALQDLARALLAEFGRESPTSPDYGVVMDILARAAIDVFDAAVVSRTTYSYSNDGPAERMVGLVEFCFNIGARNACSHLLDRLLIPPKGITVEKHLSNVLSPFLSLLHRYLATQRLDFQTEPFKGFAVAVITSFASEVMHQKHADSVPVQLENIGCGCEGCSALKRFFLGHDQIIIVRDSQDARQHLEYQLQKTPAKSFEINWETVRTGRPHGLKITKPSNMTPHGFWSANSKSGAKLLATLGDPQMQKSILGSAYESIRADITGQALSGEKRQADSRSAAPSTAAKKPRLA